MFRNILVKIMLGMLFGYVDDVVFYQIVFIIIVVEIDVYFKVIVNEYIIFCVVLDSQVLDSFDCIFC